VSKQVFRSPTLVVVWWVWLLFAVGNLIDLAVQGRDHESLVAAFILVFVTGIVYVTAQRPRIIADANALTIVNPLREHRVGWPAVSTVDSTDLIRVRVEWPEGQGEPTRRVIHAWAAGTSKRRQMAAQMRERRRARGWLRAFGPGAGASGFGASPGGAAASAPEYTDQIITTLTVRAEEVRQAAPEATAERPVSTWYWPAFAALVVPAVALLIVALL
jgi:hypothetical protein